MPDAPRLTDFERARIEVEALIPIIRAFENELGVERAHEIVARARAETTKVDVERALKGKRLTKMPFSEKGLAKNAGAGGALEYEILREDEEAFDFNVTRCRYKEMMEELDALDLGRAASLRRGLSSRRGVGSRSAANPDLHGRRLPVRLPVPRSPLLSSRLRAG